MKTRGPLPSSPLPDVLRAMLAENSRLTLRVMAEACGVSRQRISQVIRQHKLPWSSPYTLTYTPKASSGEETAPAALRRRHGRVHASPPAPTILTGSPCCPLTHNAAGTISELIAAADLTARGWFVFFPLVRTAIFDLIATTRDGETVLRIEVKSGKRKGESVLFQTSDASLCDHHAIVLAGEPVIYRPDIPLCTEKRRR